ncbi:ferric reductase like transmembrane component-domain-containing protein [Boeremia exigua]|uniref:ferric reductase like transmembrane component-domain-containing protein n=1 Tax=Boeremia exigua TaxID=749465 RepID=UPI001E8CFC1D|nr:ferric reductase like transmembrane component-domain-containing protein [Boeremia exigua]KAH6639534.1 ferric reductase like transmembrane component-domain-containing protein [Boeremia exigua]
MLAVICAYLIIFSLVGITYKSWKTPIKGTDLHNIRSGIGGFADRLGAFAFALTPLTIALCARESVLSLLTGIPYQSFNFLHRWTGRIILVQSFVHCIVWTVVEGYLYQPQPKIYVNWIKQEYMIWGIVAQALITFLFVFSLRPVIRWTGYEFFRKSHFLVAILYIGACWGHWKQLSCWMIASFALMGFDLVARTARTFLIHFGYKDGSSGFGFRSIPAKMEILKDPTGTIIRMTFSSEQSWELGQHFYLTFPALGIWQSHPFTPASNPNPNSPVQTHTYIIRACNGETKRLAELAEAAANRYPHGDDTTPVILQGPYGGSIINNEVSNILAISGGTGITYTLPLIKAALAEVSPVRNIELVWTIRHTENLAWIGPELAYLKSQLNQAATQIHHSLDEDKLEKAPIVSVETKKRFRIRIFVTRPDAAKQQRPVRPQRPDEKDKDFGFDEKLSPVSSVSSDFDSEIEDLIQELPNFSITYLNNARPQANGLVDAFMDETVEIGRTQVVGSGPPELGTQIRAAVAARNLPGNVWRGDDRGDVECVWDDRMG